MTKIEYMYGKDFDRNILHKELLVLNYKLERLKLLLSELTSINQYALDEDRIRNVTGRIKYLNYFKDICEDLLNS